MFGLSESSKFYPYCLDDLYLLNNRLVTIVAYCFLFE